MSEKGGDRRSNAPKNLLSKNDFRTLLAIAVVCAAAVSGCRKPSRGALEPAQVHTITQEFAGAASASAPAGTEVWTAKRASAAEPEAPDGVSILTPIDAKSAAGQAALSRLVQALEEVATSHHLTEDSPEKSALPMKLVFRRAGIRTHEIEIVTRRLGATGAGEHGQLAIILDDLGNDAAAAKAVFALPYPLTISVLPHNAHSVEIAEEAHRRGYEVMLHLPMQAVGTQKPEEAELRPGMSAEEVRKFTEEMIGAVPYAVGVNNHQGSEATADAELMNELMPVLREHGLFYIDSRTTAATVAYDTARNDNVHTAFRNVPFLDDVEETGAIRKQLEIAMRGAREKGEAIAIGHPHPETIEVLSEMLPKAQAEGVRLVLVSDLVH
ncbi:MAG TPA: divergent polysaccharide deacetylase family protein [Candidatus Acidoferrum sp.]|nr:divergent polysaccharide deacetylase family protein [Candidatus Acidoferrum sp.]